MQIGALKCNYCGKIFNHSTTCPNSKTKKEGKKK